jgi:hypothetical protein
MNSARDALMQAFSAAGQQVYQAQAEQAKSSSEGAGPQAGEEPAGADAEEDVVEADFEIVEDEKN